MNKRIKVFLCVILCWFYVPTHTTSLPAKTIPFFAFKDIHKIIGLLRVVLAENPHLSLAVAAIISLIGYTGIFFHKKNIPSLLPQKPYANKVQIEYDKDKNNFILTLISGSEKSSYPGLHCGEISPCNNYMLMYQLQDASTLYRLYKNRNLGAKDLVPNLFNLFPFVLLIDIQTRKVIKSFENARCTFSPDQLTLLIQEEKILTQCEKLIQAFWRYWVKEEFNNNEKDTSRIQYRLFDIKAQKDIKKFPKARSVFFNHNNLIVINDAGEKSVYAMKIGSFPFTTINPFGSKIYCPKVGEDDLRKQAESPLIEYYFNNVDKAWHLFLKTSEKEQDIKDVKTYTTNDSYVIINKDPVEQNKLQTILTMLPSALLNPTEFLANVVNVLEKPQFVTQIIDLSTGEFIPSFSVDNPLMCAVMPQTNEIIIIEFNKESNAVGYKKYNPRTDETFLFDEAVAIGFNGKSAYEVIDRNDIVCKSQKKTMVNRFEAVTELAKEKFAAFLQPKQEAILPVIELSDIDLTQLTWANYPFYSKKLSNCPKTKTDYIELLKARVHSFCWNLHTFNLTFPNTLEDHLFVPEGRICISNLAPKDMQYLQYQSLTSELKKILLYMKQESNAQAIITIFLVLNDCAINKVNQEIEEVCEKYDPLITSTYLWQKGKNLEDLPVQEMLQDQKRLIFFCGTEENSDKIFSEKLISKCITYV